MEHTKFQALNKKLSLNCKGQLVLLNQPLVMGIVNATPDSFFAHSRKQGLEDALKQAEQMIRDGATFIDIGGYSSRPGADDVSEEEELNRVIPVIEYLSKHLNNVLISVDTFRASIAKMAVEAGAFMVNDISSGDADDQMMPTVASLNVPYIMMHKQGSPKTMQQHPSYKNVTLDVLKYFNEKISLAKQAGITDLIIDPGFGFGKTLSHNYQLLRELADFNIAGLPVLVGVSRKKMIQTIANVDVAHALNGTSAANTIAVLNGANILRVHDVKEAVECINIVKATYGNI